MFSPIERVSRVESSATTHFHYDQDGRLLAESDGTGVLVREYLWLGDKPLGLVVGPVGSPTLFFVHADHLERVQKITDAAQAIVWDGQFTPYGRTHAITGTVQNPLRLPGQWADPAANYFYNYMRDYDPTLARYLSVDPIGSEGGRNRFSYVSANPQNLVDPTGEQSLSPGSQFVLLGLTGAALSSVVRDLNCQPFSLGQTLTDFGLSGLLGFGPRLIGLGLRGLGALGRGAAPGLAPALGPGAGAGGARTDPGTVGCQPGAQGRGG